MALDLQTHIGAYRHTDGNGKSKAADAFGDFGGRQYIAGQCHGCRTTYGINGAHVQSNHDQSAEQGEGNERREGKAEQGQKQQINPIAVKVIQRIPGHRTEQNGGYRHSRQDDANPGTGNPNLLAVDRDNGDGGIKGSQHQQVCKEKKDKSSIPDFLIFFHSISSFCKR